MRHAGRTVASPPVTHEELIATAWWASLPAGRVTRLDGVRAELVEIALNPLPAGAPAVITYRPDGAGPVADQVALVLDELDRAATGLFPHWLPDAARLDGPQGNGVLAVRTMALARAGRSQHFGPFLADLAERALRGTSSRTVNFAPVIRAEGLARVLADSYVCPYTVLLVDVPTGLDARAERTLLAAAEWLADRGRFGVWLTGALTPHADRVATAVVDLPAYVANLDDDEVTQSPTELDRPAVSYPALAGSPRFNSRAEQALERVLTRHEWAAGRVWNGSYRSGPLAPVYQLDLCFPAARCVVEIDGREHYSRAHYANDRRRDVHLQLDGYLVVRFTNEQVLDDVHLVVSQIAGILHHRQPHILESRPHG